MRSVLSVGTGMSSLLVNAGSQLLMFGIVMIAGEGIAGRGTLITILAEDTSEDYGCRGPWWYCTGVDGIY